MGNKFGRGSRPSKKGASAVKSHESEDEETKLPHRMELINEAKEVNAPCAPTEDMKLPLQIVIYLYTGFPESQPFVQRIAY